MLAGRPLVWFSNHAAACFIYIPAAAAGLLLPYGLAQTLGLSINCQVAGVCLLEAGLAAAVTLVGGKVAYSHALRAYAAYLSLSLVGKVCLPWLHCGRLVTIVIADNSLRPQLARCACHGCAVLDSSPL